MSGGSLYSISPDVHFRLAGADRVEARTGSAESYVITLPIYELLLKFAGARTLEDVYSELEVEISFEQFSAIMLRYADARLLVQHAQQEQCSLASVLNSEIFGDPETLSQISKRLRANQPCFIRNAFAREYAESVAESLDRFNGWMKYEHFDTFFHFQHHNLYEPWRYPEVLAQCRALFASTATKRFAEELSGVDCTGELSFSASLYLPGDYSLPHTDEDGVRSVAFVWHLARNWSSSWGGHLYWCSPPTYLNAEFNTLTLFTVSPDTFHFVTPVSPHAKGKRLAVNGWWTRSDASVKPGPQPGWTAGAPVHEVRPGLFGLDHK